MKSSSEEIFAMEQRMLHEKKTNKVVGLVSLGLAFTCFLLQIMFVLKGAPIMTMINSHVFMPISSLIIIFYLVAYWSKFEGSWVKYMLVSGIIVFGMGCYFVFSNYAAYFILLPIIMSLRYLNKPFIVNISVITIAFFLLSCIINTTVGLDWDLLMFNHDHRDYCIWEEPVDVIVYVLVPSGFMIAFVTAYSIDTTKIGTQILKEQAVAAYRISSVEAELDMAASIQRSSLPEESFITPDKRFALEAREITAKEVGGDFYDYYMLNDHTLAVIIADVSDKGVPAAMFMMSAKKSIRCALAGGSNLKDVISIINKLIYEDNKSGMFLTLWLGVIDIRSGRGKYINAGHPFPLIKSEDGKLRWIDNEPDVFLGCFKDMCPEVHTFFMEEKETLLIYTDGITDARNGEDESFGTDGIFKAFEEHKADEKNAAAFMLEEVEKFSKGQQQFDDMTLLSLECKALEPFKCENFEVDLDEEGINSITDGVNSILKEILCPEDVAQRIDVVIDEQLSNILIHGYKGEKGKVEVFLKTGSDYLSLVFRDYAKEFNPLIHKAEAREDVLTIGGLGIHFIKSIADNVSYRYIDGKNELTVEFLWGM